MPITHGEKGTFFLLAMMRAFFLKENKRISKVFLNFRLYFLSFEIIIMTYVCIEQNVDYKGKRGLSVKKVEDYVRSIPDFPEEGIIFRDITSVLQDAEGLKLSIDSMIGLLDGLDFDVVAGTESRGFIFGVPVAYALNKPFVPVRKKGKLPCETVEATYDLEYGSATIEMHKDSIQPGQKVVLVDDLIATGGTIEAAIKLVEQLGGEVVKVIFLMELAGLKGRDRLGKYDVSSVIVYEGK